MFKSMRLATKLALGFGAMVVIAAVMGVVSWTGIKGGSENVALANEGKACTGLLEQCGTYRRDFAANGFNALGSTGKDASVLWHETYEALNERLSEFVQRPGLDGSHRKALTSAQEQAAAYRAAFESQVDAARKRDDAFQAWSRIAGEFTQANQALAANEIGPKLAEARASQDVASLSEWSAIASELDSQVLKPFLLLRVNAIYLVHTKTDAQWEAYRKQLATTREGLDRWAQRIAGKPQLEAAANQIGEYLAGYEEAGEDFRAGVMAERAADKEMALTAASVLKTMTDLDAALEAKRESAEARVTFVTMAMAISAVVVGLLLAVMITRGITKALTQIIFGLDEGAKQVNDAAYQVSSSSQQLAEGASEQASSLEETSSALEEMAAMMRTNAASAKEANDLSSQAKDAAEAGDHTMQTLNAAMSAINDSSSQISKIIKVIEEIAFQTNLLALNAAVEAARAGEHGKGFAVVADEVRNLAQRAAQAAGETTTLIEDSVSKAREGTDVASQVGEALTGIVRDVAQVATLIESIAKATNEQSQGIDQVNTAVGQMDQVTQQNASGAEECASAAEELSAQAEQVNGMVVQLRTLIDGGSADVAARRPSRPNPSTGKTVRSQPKPGKKEAPSMTFSSGELGPMDEF